MLIVTSVRSAVGARALTGSADRALGRPAGRADAGVVRFLGVRQVLQALVVRLTGWHALSAAVDLLHGVSMLVLLLVPRWRRFAAAQAATAAALIVLELRAERSR